MLSRFTAYVAIDHAETANKGGKLHRITQPVGSPQGWAMQERALLSMLHHAGGKDSLAVEMPCLRLKAVSAAFDRTAPLPRTRNWAVALRDMLAAARGGRKGLNVLTTLYLIGAAIAVLMIFANWEGYTRQEGGGAIFAYSMFFLLWGGLIWASAYLAFRKGREVVEGAVLGAFGLLGFIIEVLLPANKDKKDYYPGMEETHDRSGFPG